MKGSFFQDMLTALSDSGRLLLGRGRSDGELAPKEETLSEMCEALLSGRGEATGVALADAIIARYHNLNADGRKTFLTDLAENFGTDRAKLDAAVQIYLDAPDEASISALHDAAEPRRQELLRRLNLAPSGTAALVRLREETFRYQHGYPAIRAMDADFRHLFTSWFNRGFLFLKRIDWTTPANILEKIIRYEAVHTIGTWDDLRQRLEPPDRRCFAFFHPQLMDDPLIFVEVALTGGIPGSIAEILAPSRQPLAPNEANTAVFYSISNCQPGLRGISFGNFLIKQVAEDLRRELPGLATFVTLSPAPGFAAWLQAERNNPAGQLSPDVSIALEALDDPSWTDQPELLKKAILAAAAQYFLIAKSTGGKPPDAVARFHLGNGAVLERLNWLGDISENGMAQSCGIMVNYLYRLQDIEANHEAYAGRGEVVASSSVRQFLSPLPARPKAAPKREAPEKQSAS